MPAHARRVSLVLQPACESHYATRFSRASASATSEPLAVEHPLLDHAVHVDPHRAHHAAEHRVVAGHDHELEELRAAELGLAALHELGGRGPAGRQLAYDRQRQRLARREGLAADVAALDGADL